MDSLSEIHKDYSDFLQLEKEVPEKATKTKEIEPNTKGPITKEINMLFEILFSMLVWKLKIHLFINVLG